MVKKEALKGRFVLAADIGGTNTRIGVFSVKPLKQVFTLVFDSKKIKDVSVPIVYTLEYAKKNYGIRCYAGCISGAGPVDGDVLKMTNVKFNIYRKKIEKKTGLKKVLLLNDFEAIGYGVNVLTEKVELSRKKKSLVKGVKSIIGPGTGLGKSTLVFCSCCKKYKPLQSEGGHQDLVCLDNEDREIADLIKKKKNLKYFPDYESVLSGPGIVNIYQYYRKKYPGKSSLLSKIDKLGTTGKNKMMVENYGKNKICTKVMDKFVSFLARFSRNTALETLPYSGLYIAGGIPPKIIKILKQGAFVKEFVQHEKFSYVLRKIPVYVVMDEDAGLKGAGFVCSLL